MSHVERPCLVLGFILRRVINLCIAWGLCSFEEKIQNTVMVPIINA